MALIMGGGEVMNYGGWRLPELVQVRKPLDGRSGALAVWLASLLAVVAHAAAQVRSQSDYLAANLHPSWTSE
jgi:hypothetical protein